MSELVYTAHHTIYYNTKNAVPIADVILALQGLDGLLKNVPRVVEVLTGTQFERTEFFVDRVESGSLYEDIIVKFVFKDQAGLDKFIEKLRENGVVRGTVIAVVLGGLVTYGVMSALGAIKGQAPNVTANNNTIINIGAGEVNMTPEAFQAIVASAIGDKKANARDAIKFLTPAKNNPGSHVEIGGENSEVIEINMKAIAESPKSYEAKKNQIEAHLGRATVEIRATNLDSRKNGWAGKIEGITNRVSIELDSTLKESVLFGKTSVLADVTVTSTLKHGSGEYTPSKILIHAVH